MSTVPSGCLVVRLCTWQSVESRPAAREKEGRRAGRSGQPDRRALGTVSWETAPHRGYVGRHLAYNGRSARTRADDGDAYGPVRPTAHKRSAAGVFATAAPRGEPSLRGERTVSPT